MDVVTKDIIIASLGAAVGLAPTIKRYLSANSATERARIKAESSDKDRLWEHVATLEGKIGKLEGRIQALEGENGKLTRELASKDVTIARLEAENSRLQESNDALEEKNQELETENARLRAAAKVS